MTDIEIKLILQELHGAGLANEPKDPKATIAIWRDFFGGEDFRIIGKAVGMHMRNSKFWPTPADILQLKQKAQWLIELEHEKFEKLKELGNLIEELKACGLIGLPDDFEQELHDWYRIFNSISADQIRTAINRYLKYSNIWPSTIQLSMLLPTVEEQKKLNALNIPGKLIRRSEAVGASKKIESEHTNYPYQPPTAPVVQIRTKTTCEICGLCEEQDQDKCPCDF